MIDSATVLAYRQTEYRVSGSVPAVLRVGKPCAQLDLLQQLHKVDCSAFVTACNPLGKITDAATNSQRLAALAQQIRHLGHIAIDGVGQHPTDDWPPEPSYLVLGLSRDAAQHLGRQFEQNAILWAGRDAVPELVLLR